MEEAAGKALAEMAAESYSREWHPEATDCWRKAAFQVRKSIVQKALFKGRKRFLLS